MLFNIHTLQWDDELLKLFDVPASMLPEVRSSSEVYGQVSESLGIESVPIAGIAGDQQAALFGQMCRQPGHVEEHLRHRLLPAAEHRHDADASKQQLLTTVAWQIGGRTEYALEGSVFIGGAVVQWLRDGLGLIRTAAEIEPLAASVSDNGGVYLVPAFAGPRRAALGSLRARHDRRHHARHHGRAHRARRAREHRLSGRRSARRHGRRRRHSAEGAARGRRRGDQQHADAVPGRPARRAGGAARRSPRRRRSAPRIWRGSPWASGNQRTTSAANGRWIEGSNRRCRVRRPARSASDGRKHSGDRRTGRGKFRRYLRLGNRGCPKSAASARAGWSSTNSAQPEMISIEASRAGTRKTPPTRKWLKLNASNSLGSGRALSRILRANSGVWFSVKTSQPVGANHAQIGAVRA